MSRTRKAILAASFSYAQFLLAIVTGLVLVPLIISRLGDRSYGLWLASTEFLSYLALTDCGVFAILPWVVAGAHGRHDVSAIRHFLIAGLVMGAAVGGMILAGSAVAWYLLPDMLHLTEADRSALEGPLTLLVTCTALSYPMRVFAALLTGLQDVVFQGVLIVVQTLLCVGLTVTLLLQGFGLYALSAYAVIPPLLSGLASWLRLGEVAPELLREWQCPGWQSVRGLCREGIGAWLGSFGVLLFAASNSLILTFLGHPEWAPIYLCTAKLPQMLQQLSWVLPDSGLLGLAQLHGEGRPQRVREVASHILQVNLLLAGAAACLLLALNPTFVCLWVGPEFFGGYDLNAWVAGSVLMSSLVHGVVTPVAVLGWRVHIGVVTLLNGLIHILFAVFLTSHFGLLGLASGLILSSLVTSLPWGWYLQQQVFERRLRDLLSGWFLRWLCRLVPALALTGWAGPYLAALPLWQCLALSLVGGILYLWWIRPLLHDLPIPARLKPWLTRLHLLPPNVEMIPPSSSRNV